MLADSIAAVRGLGSNWYWPPHLALSPKSSRASDRSLGNILLPKLGEADETYQIPSFSKYAVLASGCLHPFIPAPCNQLPPQPTSPRGS